MRIVMSLRIHSRVGLRALLTSLLLTIVFAFGSAAGIYLYPRMIAEADSHAESDHDHEPEHSTSSSSHDDDQDHEDEHEEDDHVALTEQAYANLDLEMGTVSKADYWKTLLVPARV